MGVSLSCYLVFRISATACKRRPSELKTCLCSLPSTVPIRSSTVPDVPCLHLKWHIITNGMAVMTSLSSIMTYD